MNDPTVPLAILAAEFGTGVDTLVRRLDPDSVLLDAVGFRAVERHVAAALIDQHRLRQAKTKQRDAARRQQLAEVSARARSTIRGGVPATSDSPLADLMAIDGDPPRIVEAERRLEGWLSGRSTGARINPRRA